MKGTKYIYGAAIILLVFNLFTLRPALLFAQVGNNSTLGGAVNTKTTQTAVTNFKTANPNPTILKPKIGYGYPSNAQDFSLDHPQYLAISLGVGTKSPNTDIDIAKAIARDFWKQGVPVAIFMHPLEGLEGVNSTFYDYGVAVTIDGDDTHNGQEIKARLNRFVKGYEDSRKPGGRVSAAMSSAALTPSSN